MQNLTVDAFVREIRKKRKGRIPVEAHFELTYRCNYNCLHCYRPREQFEERELSTQEVFAILDQLAELGVLWVFFTGGEVFLRQDAMDIILYAHSRGFLVALATNAALLTPEKLDALYRRNIRHFEISFSGADTHTFERITQTPGSYRQTLTAVRRLRGKGVFPLLKTCVITLNKDEIPLVAALTEELDVSFTYSPSLTPVLGSAYAGESYRLSPEEEIEVHRTMCEYFRTSSPRRAHRKLRRTLPNVGKEKKRGSRMPGQVFRCAAGNRTIFINPYGEIRTCLGLPHPHYQWREGNVYEGWKEIKKFTDTLRAPKGWRCRSCNVRFWCGWCPGRGFLYTGDIFGCHEHVKKRAACRKYFNEGKNGAMCDSAAI